MMPHCFDLPSVKLDAPALCALVPVLGSDFGAFDVFWVWPHSQVLQNEFDDVRDRHLLLARNLSAALELYHQDVRTAFNLIASNKINGREVDRRRTSCSI